MVDWKPSDQAENFSGLLPVILLRIPTRRLWAPENTEEEKNTGYQLKGHGNDPLRLAFRRYRSSDNVVDPETQHATSSAAALANSVIVNNKMLTVTKSQRYQQDDLESMVEKFRQCRQGRGEKLNQFQNLRLRDQR